MDEVLGVLQAILAELQQVNKSLNDLKGMGIFSIDDVCGRLDDIAGHIESVKGPMDYNLTDIHSTLGSIDDSISRI